MRTDQFILSVIWRHFIVAFIFFVTWPLVAQTNKFYTLEGIRSKWKGLPLDEVTRVADSGDVTAQHYLGYLFFSGSGGVTNVVEGIKWFKRAAAQNLPNAQHNLGLAYQIGKGVPLDEGVAIEWYKKSASQGFVGSIVNLNLMLRKRQPNHHDPQVRDWFERSAATGDPEAQMQFGYYLSSSGLSTDVGDAVFWLKKAFNGGRMESCYYIGEIWLRSSDTNKHRLGVQWYQLGAESGDLRSKAGLGWMLLMGRGISKDPERGVRLTIEAAEAGHPHAMYTLGRLYANEELPFSSPLKKDIDRALTWYRQGAIKGNEHCMLMLGSQLIQDLSLVAHVREGVDWLLKADRGGLYEGRKRLAALALRDPSKVPNAWLVLEGVAHGGHQDQLLALINKFRSGEGVPIDYFKASFWRLNLESWNQSGAFSRQNLQSASPSRSVEAGDEFRVQYVQFSEALRSKNSAYFLKQGDMYATVENRDRDIVFAVVCYEVAGAFGDATAQRKALLLREAFDEVHSQRVAGFMFRLEYFLKLMQNNK